MPFDVEMPDGTVIQDVPDGTSKAQIAAKYQAHIGAQAPKTGPAEPSLLNNSFMTGLKEGAEPAAQLIGGLGDLLGKGMRAVGIPTRDTSKPLPDNVTVPGELLTPGTVKDDSYQPKTVAGQYARTLGQFAPSAVAGPEGAIARVSGSAIPAIASETAGQAFPGNKYARVLGALAGGGLAGPVSRGATSLTNALEMGAPVAERTGVDAIAPTVADLKQTSSDAYDSVFKDPSKNFVISKDALSRLAARVKEIATEHGYKPELNPKAAVVINDIENLPKDNSTLSGLELTRRLASNVARDFQTSDGSLAAKIKSEISGFMSDLDDKDILATAAGATDKSGIDALKVARTNWAKMRKAEIIQKIQDDADIRGSANYSQAGADGALRRGFANLATNPKKMAQFTDDEQDAIRLVAKGNMSANAMRFLGKFAVRGPVSGMAASGIGHLLGGPAGPYVLGGIGEAAKAGASSATQNNVNALSALVRGGDEAVQNLAIQRRPDLLRALQNYVPGALAAPALADTGAN